MKRSPSSSSARTYAEDLDSADRSRVLGIIDQFRELGVNEDISLPQLVVVGDQSSGKSSLLEGLTGLNFPISSELCTRFATQIVLRRAPDGKRSSKVSILPGPSSGNDEAQRERLTAFSRESPEDSLSLETFSAILDEAANCMGLPAINATNFDNLPKRFSDDVLRIELSGPTHHHLSVVDVPGLFHNPTKFQTQEDLEVIRGLLEDHVKDTRTIILAVMDGRNNLANQEVFRMARAADPQGKRTVGIITKCDLVADGDEQGVLDIAKNKVEHLAHGWFAVRNRSTKDIREGVTLSRRNENESKFFSTTPWNSMPKDRTGIQSLKKFLASLLYEHIRGEYPALVQELRQLVSVARVTMDALGPPRQTTAEQRQYLFSIASQYQTLVTDCLRGGYGSDWASDDPRKLRMHLHNLHDAFATAMAKEGHSFAFCNADNSVDSEYDTKKKGTEAIYDWIRQAYRESRGAELPGTVNPRVVENLFRQQAKSWATMATNHLGHIHERVCQFNDEIWRELVPDEMVRDRVMSYNAGPGRAAEEGARRQLQLLLSDETQGILQTINHYFAENVQHARIDRIRHRLERLGNQDQQGYIEVQPSAILDQVHLSNEDQAVFDTHDSLKAYYKVSMKRFMDNVVIQCVERYYIGEDGPVKHFTPTYVGALTTEELESIAAESYSTSMTRTETSQRLDRLEKALALAEKERL